MEEAADDAANNNFSVSSVLGEAADEVEGRRRFEKNTKPVTTLSILEEAAFEVGQHSANINEEQSSVNDILINAAMEAAGSPTVFEDDVDALVDQIQNHSRQNTDSEEDKESESDDADDDDYGDIKEENPMNIELRHCCYSGHTSRVEYLLGKGANGNSIDRHGWTCLHWAASKGHDDIVELLLNHSGKLSKFVNMKENLSGWTALHVSKIIIHEFI